MRLLSIAVMLVATLALAACNNPRGGAMGEFDAGAGAGIGTTALGDPNDPTSIAHFNQRIGDRVLFVVDSSSLSGAAENILRAQAAWLNANPQYQVLIEGHADERGTREYNIALGARRAAAIERFLVQQGVQSGRIRTVSYGKERPVEACPAARCWDQNRRGVTVVSR
ncbi:MAG: peptidoglycan-associated lipoprotein Pal [Pararhodobacter sp.]|nr:peptidoglycan-associated lipoprotein Pal [Pararhodobacter sp.]